MSASAQRWAPSWPRRVRGRAAAPNARPVASRSDSRRPAQASKPGGLAPERLLAELPASPEALLATLARRDAELREEARTLHEDVLARAREARRAAAAASPPAPAPAASAPAADEAAEAGAAAPTRQLRDAAAALREEVAKARAEARSFAPAAPLADPSWNPPPAPAPLAVMQPAAEPAADAAADQAVEAQRWIDAWRAKQRGSNGA